MAHIMTALLDGPSPGCPTGRQGSLRRSCGLALPDSRRAPFALHPEKLRPGRRRRRFYTGENVTHRAAPLHPRRHLQRQRRRARRPMYGGHGHGPHVERAGRPVGRACLTQEVHYCDCREGLWDAFTSRPTAPNGDDSSSAGDPY